MISGYGYTGFLPEGNLDWGGGGTREGKSQREYSPVSVYIKH